MSNAIKSLANIAMMAGATAAVLGLASTDPMTVAIGLFGGLLIGSIGVALRFGPPARR